MELHLRTQRGTVNTGGSSSGNSLAAPGTWRAQGIPGMLGQQHRQCETHRMNWDQWQLQSCSILGVDGMNPTPGMLGWRGQAGQVEERFDDTALTVSDGGGKPLEEDQGMENKGDAAVGYP